MKLPVNEIIQGDTLQTLKQLPDNSIDCVVTSPPYWGLRDYGVEWQLGLESTFHEYLEKLWAIFDEVKRVLKPMGTCWVNLGDSYSSGVNNNDKKKVNGSKKVKPIKAKLPPKSLCQIPSRFAIGMADRGWILRNEIIWEKPNALPSSVKDRFTVDFEKIFFFVKQKKYYFEQQFEPVKECSIERLNRAVSNKNKWANGPDGQTKQTISQPRPNRNYKRYEKSNAPHTFDGSDHLVSPFDPKKGRNKRTVWTISTKPFRGAHFAVFPPELPATCIKAGCPKWVCKKCGKPREKVFKKGEFIHTGGSRKKDTPGLSDFQKQGTGYHTKIIIGYTDCGCNVGWKAGIVLDPFMGSGTTAVVSNELGRDYIGIEINPEYVRMANKRLQATQKPLL